jgi:VWFA-related protein
MNFRGFVALFLALGGLSAVRADDPVIFRSDVALIRVDAQVVDRDNRTITGLGPQDFVLRDSGKQQKIQSVDSEKLPIDLLLLLDVSGSMRPHLQRIASASGEMMRQVRDGDRIAIMVFDSWTRVRMPFSSGRSEVEREMQRLLDQETFGGDTDISRGLLDAASYLGHTGRLEARKAIVIVTDDRTLGNRDTEGVSRALTRADTVLSVLIAPDAVLYRNMGRNGGANPGGVQIGGGLRSAGTEEIAIRSGGDSMPAENAYSLESTLARIRQRYALNFYLPESTRASEEREIQVELAEAMRSQYPGASVRYRRSYYAPSATR